MILAAVIEGGRFGLVVAPGANYTGDMTSAVTRRGTRETDAEYADLSNDPSDLKLLPINL